MAQPIGKLVPSAPLYRIDKFVVPPGAMQPFMARVRRIQRLLGALPGCQLNLVLTQTAGPSEFNVVTVVEWASAEAAAVARSSMQAQYAQEGFDPEAFIRGLGVRADLATYADAVVVEPEQEALKASAARW